MTTLPVSGLLAGRRKWAILVVVLLVVSAGVLLTQSGKNQPASTNTTDLTPENSRANTNQDGNETRQVTVPLTPDADKDGLTDQRERELGTNPRLADTDGDQAGDYDEVEVYASDPKKQDTDGDGFPDGEEVATGNNPNGPGTLRNLQQTISNINAQ